MRFVVNSKLFGELRVSVDIEDLTDDHWEDISGLLDINLFIVPDDEDKEYSEARWCASIWTNKIHYKDGRKVAVYGEEIESIDPLNVIYYED